jgi:hypothetical protein
VTYTQAALVGVAGTIALDLFVLRTRLLTRRLFGILTGRNVVMYDPTAITGLRIVFAPVEDLLFGFALVVQTLSWWTWWGRRLPV